MANNTVGVMRIGLNVNSKAFIEEMKKSKEAFADFGKLVKSWVQALIRQFLNLSRAFLSFAKDCLNTTTKMETVRNSFKQLMGEAAGIDFTDWLREFANKTPFKLEGILNASKQLLSFGMTAEQVKATMQRLGEAAAYTGRFDTLETMANVIGLILAKGKVSAIEMIRLTTAGLPAWQMLADSMGVSVPEAMNKVTKGAVSSSEALTGLLSQMEKYQGFMNSLAKTPEGLLSTLDDELETLKDTVGQTLMPVFIQAIKYMTAFVQIVTEFVSAHKDDIMQWVQNTFRKITPVLFRIGAVITGIIEGLRNMAPIIQTVANAFVIVYNTIMGIAQVIANIIQGIIMIGDGIKRSFQPDWDAEAKSRWVDENMEQFKSINEQFSKKYLHFNVSFDDLIEQGDRAGGAWLEGAMNSFGKINDMVAKQMAMNEADLTKPAPMLDLPDFEQTKQQCDEIAKMQTEMYDKIAKKRDEYFGVLRNLGTNAWAMLDSNYTALAENSYNDENAKQISLLEQIAANTSGINDMRTDDIIQSIPMGGY